MLKIMRFVSMCVVLAFCVVNIAAQNVLEYNGAKYERIEQDNGVSYAKVISYITSTIEIADSIDSIQPIPDGNFPPFIEGAEQQLSVLKLGLQPLIEQFLPVLGPHGDGHQGGAGNGNGRKDRAGRER